MKNAQNTTRFAHAIYCKSSSLPILLTSRNLSEIRQKIPHFSSERVAIVRMDEYTLLRRLAAAPTLRVPTKKVPLTKYEKESLVKRAMDGYFDGAAGRIGGVKGVLVALGLLPPEPAGSKVQPVVRPTGEPLNLELNPQVRLKRPTGELPVEPKGSAKRRTPAPTDELAGSTKRPTRTNPRVRYKYISAETAEKLFHAGRRGEVQCIVPGGTWVRPSLVGVEDTDVSFKQWPPNWKWRQVLRGSAK